MSVESALRDANVEVPDARGLMPVDRAREILAAATVVDRDTLDPIWAAMLCLATAEELVTATRHLEWRMPVRGMENLALVERYGAGALRWIATRVQSGVLINHPWCVVPSLMALDEPAVLDLLLSIRGAITDGGSMKYWQFTPADIGIDTATLDRNALELVLEWARRHPEIAGEALAARPDSPRAVAALREIAERNELSVERVLSTLDAACRAEVGFWPWFNTGVDGRMEYFGMRLIAVRSKTTNAWGLVLERLMGCDPDSFQIARYAYGPGTTDDSNFDHIHSLEEALQIVTPKRLKELEEEDDESTVFAKDDDDDYEGDDDDRPVFTGMIAHGEAGDLLLDEALFARFDLKPGLVTESGGWMARTLAIRAYLEAYPKAFWPEPEEAIEASGVPDGEILLVSTSYEQPGGHRNDGGPSERWHVLPSESDTFRSLADAIVTRDASRFVPGTSNLDWRLHATEQEDGYTPPWRTHRVGTSGGYIAAAMKEAEVVVDERGLMPLAEARAIAKQTTSLARGDGRYVGKRWVWDLDRTWAALLSLADAHEAAAWMRTLELVDPPRDAASNRAIVERYGDGALRIVAARADAAGVIHATSPILRATVLAVGTPEGFAFVWDLAGWNEVTATEGDDDEEGAAPQPPDAQATALFAAWMVPHPEVGFVELAKRARTGDAAAASYLQSWAAPQVRRVYGWLVPALGEPEARAVLAGVGHSCDLAPAQILASLDTAVAADVWPQIQTNAGPSRELHGMRLIGARARGSEDWVVVIERFEGYTFHNCRIHRYVYGEHGASGSRDELRLTIVPQELPQLPIHDADTLLVEPPDHWTKIDNAPAAIASIRAVLRAEPGRFFGPPEPLLAQLGIADPAVVIATMQFEHTSGNPLPSTLISYRSLAEALVAGDAARFTPGTPNAGYAPYARSLEAHAADTVEEDEEDEEEDDDEEESNESNESDDTDE